jgi:hypothetical protein
MNKNQTSAKAYKTAIEHGFKIGGVNTPDNLNNALGELQEGARHIRELGKLAFITSSNSNILKELMDSDISHRPNVYNFLLDNTVEMELADTKLRLFTLGHHYKANWSESAYSRDQAAIARTLKTYAELSLHCSKLITNISHFIPDGRLVVESYSINAVIDSIDAWCGKEGINIDWFVDVKMKYNEGREYLHGNKNLLEKEKQNESK